MMQLRKSAVSLAVLTGFLIAAAPTLAASSPSSPAIAWIELHFSNIHGQTKTIVEMTSLKRAGMIGGYCNTELPSEHDIAHGAFLSHPELAGMTFVGANCGKDSAGNFKITVGNQPARSR